MISSASRQTPGIEMFFELVDKPVIGKISLVIIGWLVDIYTETR